MLLTLLLASARFLHYTAATVMFGAALFPLYAFAGRTDGGLARVVSIAPKVAAIAALVSGVAWFLFTAAGMAGDLASILDLPSLWFVAVATPFGRAWLARMALAGLIVWLTLGRPSRARTLALLSGMLLASIALTGHTQVEGGAAGLLHVGADAAHLLGAGAWLGALVPLLALSRVEPQAARARGLDIGLTLSTFSSVGVAAVVVLVLTGLVNAWFLVGDPRRLVTTPYGLVLSAKLAAFALMLVLAAANRFWITAALSAGVNVEEAGPWLARLRRHIVAEQALGLLVLALVGYLGTQAPAAGG
jgi:putative copper resistance protein D